MYIREIMDTLNGNARRRANCRIAIGTSIGLVLGVGVALLLAPKSGKQTRDDIKHGAELGIEKAREITTNAANFVKKEAAMVSEAVTEKVEDLKSPSKKAKEASKDLTDRDEEETES